MGIVPQEQQPCVKLQLLLGESSEQPVTVALHVTPTPRKAAEVLAQTAQDGANVRAVCDSLLDSVCGATGTALAGDEQSVPPRLASRDSSAGDAIEDGEALQ